jgi:endonuclease/exonuclease/phosphatase family metal-dependent hydrolase
MKKAMILFMKALLFLVIASLVYIAGTIIFAMVFDYKPSKENNAEIKTAKTPVASKINDTLSFITWNLGYGGLGKESDFFYDGGKMVRPTKILAQKNNIGIQKQIQQFNSQNIDFLLFQEVDINSKRSYHTNQWENASNILDEYHSSFGKNYDVKYVPIPLTKPMGKALGGVVSFYKTTPSQPVKRYSFPANFAFPKGLFFLDRCFTLHRFPYKDKELIVINTHNSAYDGGTLKKEEMAYFHDYLTVEYERGNYVVVGGDWNQIPPGYTPKLPAGVSNYEETPIPEGYLPLGWTWAFDGNTATNRKVDAPFQEGKTYTTVIDFFLLSPNISLIEVKGIANGFENSDHQPVFMKIKLN